MKKLVYLAFVLCGSPSIAQFTDVVTGLNQPTSMAFHGGDLYFTVATDNKICKIDSTVANPVAVDVATGLSNPQAILLVGNYLYVSEFNADKISRIDLLQSNPVPETVKSGIDAPLGMAVKGNFLYVCESNNHRVSKMDITLADPPVIPVMTGLNFPVWLAFNGNQLYISIYFGNKISKIDVTSANPLPVDVVTGLNRPIGITFNGNDLYICESDGNKISRKNIGDGNPSVTLFTGLGRPVTTAFSIEGVLYVAEIFAGKITRYTGPLSSDQPAEIQKTVLYPNPAGNYAVLGNVPENTPYLIFDALGREVMRGMVSENAKIDTSGLPGGLYLLKTVGDKEASVPFIKS